MSNESTVTVKISAKSARLLFHGCEPGYIQAVCHAACCDAPSRPTGMLVAIHHSEQPRIEARGGRISLGLLQPIPGKRGCPFKTGAHLCALHGGQDKPFGCIASPFTLNRNNTLIVRNRYKLLRCYRDGLLPAYRAFGQSLVLLFGALVAARITRHLDAGGADLLVPMSASVREMLVTNDAVKQKHPAK